MKHRSSSSQADNGHEYRTCERDSKLSERKRSRKAAPIEEETLQKLQRTKESQLRLTMKAKEAEKQYNLVKKEEKKRTKEVEKATKETRKRKTEEKNKREEEIGEDRVEKTGKANKIPRPLLSFAGPLADLPPAEDWKVLSYEKREQYFFRFLKETALKTSADPIINGYELGGIASLLPDVQMVCKKILTRPWQIEDKFWHVLLVAWLGSGGPAFKTYLHCNGEVDLFHAACPEEARLPTLQQPVSCFYNHLAGFLSTDLGPGQEKVTPKRILSGDGRYAYGRFGDMQGEPLLQDWQAKLNDLMREEHWQSFGPQKIDKFLQRAHGMAPLSLKEISCYMQPLLPVAFDANDFVEYGDGAVSGASMIFGRNFTKNESDKREIHRRTVDLVRRVPEDIARDISAAVKARLRELPPACQNLPGIAQRLQAEPKNTIDALDLEIAYCWCQGYLRARHVDGSLRPPKWAAFGKSVWASVLSAA